MRSIFLRICVWVCFIIISSSALASETVRLNCYFTYASNRSDFQEQLGDNKEELEKLDAVIRRALDDKQLAIKRIRLSGYTSGDVSQASNRRLENERVWSFREYITDRYPVLNRYPMDVVWTSESRKARNDLSPLVRRIEIIIDFEPKDLDLLSSAIGRDASQSEEPFIDPLIYNVLDRKEGIQIPNREFSGTYPWEVRPSKRGRKTASSASSYSSYTSYTPRWAVRTNLLLWAGIMADAKHTTYTPNLSLEYYLTDHWAVEAGMEYSDWRYDNGNRYHGLSGYRLEPRYWFKLPNQKYFMYAGAYGRVGEYTYSQADDVQTVGATGHYWDAGLSAGLYLHLTNNLGIELAARAGYVRTEAKLYTVEDGHRYLDGYQLYNKVKVTGLMLNVVYRWR